MIDDPTPEEGFEIGFIEVVLLGMAVILSILIGLVAFWGLA